MLHGLETLFEVLLQQMEILTVDLLATTAHI